MRNWFTFSGRIGRLEYLWRHLVIYGIELAIIVVGIVQPQPMLGIALLVAILAHLASSTGMKVRRLRDLGMAWQWVLIVTLPWVLFVLAVIVVAALGIGAQAQTIGSILGAPIWIGGLMFAGLMMFAPGRDDRDNLREVFA